MSRRERFSRVGAVAALMAAMTQGEVATARALGADRVIYLCSDCGEEYVQIRARHLRCAPCQKEFKARQAAESDPPDLVFRNQPRRGTRAQRKRRGGNK